MVMLEKSFEEISKTAYSHGLEAIYSLQTVDLRSLRPMQMVEPITATRKRPSLSPQPPLSSQYEFDFGVPYRPWMAPFFLDEPIRVLKLSKHAEKALADTRRSLLRHLHGADLRGLGQGHIEEIRTKFEEYVAGRDAERAFRIDFGAWIRALFAQVPVKKAAVFLEQYSLADLVSLSPAESVEVKKLTEGQRKEWIRELRLPSMEMALYDVREVFLKPWMVKRHGLATKNELQERLERMSEDPALALKAFAFFGDALPGLNEAENGIFCTDSAVQKDFRQLVACACTYFYRPGVSYPLKDLTLLLKREFAHQWIGFTEGFVEKVLCLSRHFRLFRSLGGQLILTKDF